MIEKLRVLSERNDFEMELRNPWESGVAIVNITGIGPGKALTSMQERAGMDGGLLTSVRLPARTISITIKPQFSETVEETRIRCYKIWPIKQNVRMYFKTELRDVYIDGCVDSVEPNIFQEEVELIVTVTCENPYFIRSNGSEVSFSNITPMFEFPFANESLIDPLLIFGEIKDFTEENIVYEGDSDVGMVIHILFSGRTNNITIHNVAERDSMRILTNKIYNLTGSYITDEDELVISTVKGNKYVKLIRQGVSINVLNAFDRTSEWIQLHPGDNILTYVAESGAENMKIRIEFDTLYSGI